MEKDSGAGAETSSSNGEMGGDSAMGGRVAMAGGGNGAGACGTWDFESSIEGWFAFNNSHIKGEPDPTWDGRLTTSTARSSSGPRSLLVGCYELNGSTLTIGVPLCSGQSVDVTKLRFSVDISAQPAPASPPLDYAGAELRAWPREYDGFNFGSGIEIPLSGFATLSGELSRSNFDAVTHLSVHVTFWGSGSAWMEPCTSTTRVSSRCNV